MPNNTLSVTARLPVASVEAIRSPRDAIAAGKATLLRRLRLAEEAARELEWIAYQLDPKYLTHAGPLATFAAVEVNRVTACVADINHLERLPVVATVKRAGRARTTTNAGRAT